MANRGNQRAVTMGVGAGLFVVCGVASGGCVPPDPTEVKAESAFVMVAPPRGHTWTRSGRASDSGEVVVGFSGAVAGNALSVFRWTAAGGVSGDMAWLQPPRVDPLALFNVFSVGVSGDGTTLLGSMFHERANSLFLWSETRGMVDLGAVPGVVLADIRVQVSRTGRVVMGTADGQAFRWTHESGRVTLGALPGDPDNEAVAMNADGTVIVGNSRRADGSSRVFRWTPDSGLGPLSGLPAGASCRNFGQLSADGKVLFGQCERLAAEEGGAPEPLAQTQEGAAPVADLFRWVDGAPAGSAEIIAVSTFHGTALPWGATPDGATLVGWLGSPNSAGTLFRWTRSAGLVALVPPPGFGECLAPRGLSTDGRMVLGVCRSGGRVLGVRWNAAGVGVALEPPAGFAESHPSSMSADGHVIAGHARQRAGTTEKDAFDTAVVWDDRQGAGPRRLTDILRAGLDVGTVPEKLRTLSAQVAPDGRTLFGEALDPQARQVGWLARLP